MGHLIVRFDQLVSQSGFVGFEEAHCVAGKQELAVIHVGVLLHKNIDLVISSLCEILFNQVASHYALV